MKFSIILTFTLWTNIGLTQPDLKAPVLWIDNLSGDFSFSKQKSILCEAWCYEWAGTDKIKVSSKAKDTVICHTMMNEATHCSLHLIVTKDSCKPSIELLSITPNGNKIYPYKSGFIKIDKSLWKRKVMKAEFSFEFINDENDKRIFWEGKIYAKIK